MHMLMGVAGVHLLLMGVTGVRLMEYRIFPINVLLYCRATLVQ